MAMDAMMSQAGLDRTGPHGPAHTDRPTQDQPIRMRTHVPGISPHVKKKFHRVPSGLRFGQDDRAAGHRRRRSTSRLSRS